ncbi:hypothetical protein [Kingella potus]|uniref:hypothetical protein n=1 Tax=Kingella potus TaxID=265175 RepID=UPI001FD56DAE|nr:hypothetical protein [Kingella potus]UOP00178.1 hypothetical protein LVJ84_09560 [Kingella potus]
MLRDARPTRQSGQKKAGRLKTALCLFRRPAIRFGSRTSRHLQPQQNSPAAIPSLAGIFCV